MNSYHEQLQIVSGVPLTPGNTTTQERGLQVIDLLSTGTGWSVDPEWYPARPALKNGGIWQNSNAADGATLLDAYDGNVIENIQLDLSASSAIELHTRLSIMEKMIRDARLFWSTDWQIEPVYLRWWAKGAKGPQFALIYNIEMDVARNGTVEDYTRSVSLQITREPYWRWEVEPGASPLKWLNFKNGGTWGVGASYNRILNPPIQSENDATGLTDADPQYALIENYHRTLQSAAAAGGTTCNQNFITVPAENLPGDAPALVMLASGYSVAGSFAAGSGGSYINKLWISRKTNPPYENRFGGNVVQRTTWPARTSDGAGLISATDIDTAFANNTGAYSNTSATCAGAHTGQIATCTFATTITDARRLYWTSSMNTHRGRYMAFIRGFQTGGTAGQVSMYLKYGFYNGLETQTTPVNPPVRALTNPQRIIDIVYMGEIVLPPDRRVGMGNNQYGLIQDTTNNLLISLYASAANTTPDLNIFDLVLMPIDEAALVVDFGRYIDELGASFAVEGNIVYDNTGYYSRGRGTIVASQQFLSTDGATVWKVPEASGMDFYLEPGVENRIYFMWADYQSGVAPEKNTCYIVPNLDPPSSSNNYQNALYLFIIPRSIGARDD